MPNPVAQNGQPHVISAIRRAAEATGVGFDYLVRTAQRESSLNPLARARTSSATGLFQFIDQTWLATLKTAGPKHGYGMYAAQIVQRKDGSFHVPDPQSRQQVMGLRYNADANALMGAEFASRNAAYLGGRIGRAPTEGELYVAHFLGAGGAAELIQAAQSRPTASAAALFPSAARANPSIFYANGQPLSVGQVYSRLTAKGGNPVELPAESGATGFVRSPDIQARYDRLEEDRRIMRLAFGDENPAGSLVSTQLLSAFGPGEDERKEKEGDDFMSRALSGYSKL